MRTLLIALAAVGLMVAPTTISAEPPAHAPAHGYRAKAAKAAKAKSRRAEPRKGIEVVFDSERGIYVGVGFPDIVFHENRYYREHDGRWQVSVTGDGNWRVSATAEIPSVVLGSARSHKKHPGPAKMQNH